MRIVLSFFIFVFADISCLLAGPLDTWHVRSAEPAVTETLGAVIFGGNTFVAVGNRGVVVTSNDGITWKQQRLPIIQEFSSYAPSQGKPIAYGRGLFVTVGFYGEIFTSTNALNWERLDSDWFSHLRSVHFGNGLFVAVGFGGLILTSTDGFNWTQRNSHTTHPLGDVASGNGRFLVSGSIAFFNLISTNGTDWFYGESVLSGRLKS